MILVMLPFFRFAMYQRNGQSLEVFLAFADSDPAYRKCCDELTVLLGTGLRISELCGLTVDLDFENRRIDVDH